MKTNLQDDEVVWCSRASNEVNSIPAVKEIEFTRVA